MDKTDIEERAISLLIKLISGYRAAHKHVVEAAEERASELLSTNGMSQVTHQYFWVLTVYMLCESYFEGRCDNLNH